MYTPLLLCCCLLTLRQIHASLTEWRTGTQTHVAFSADSYLDVYNEHKILLAGIRGRNARGFHNMMHRLYREARLVVRGQSYIPLALIHAHLVGLV